MTGITEFLSLEVKKEQVASLRAYTEVEVKVSKLSPVITTKTASKKKLTMCLCVFLPHRKSIAG